MKTNTSDLPAPAPAPGFGGRPLPPLPPGVTLDRATAPSIVSPSYDDEAGIRSLVDQVSAAQGVDPRLVHAVVKTESNYDPFAVSKVGALGLMQLMPATGGDYGVQNFFDPRENVEGGVKYLKDLLGQFNGDIDKSVAAYNAGAARVKQYGGIPPFAETQDYVRKVRDAMENPDDAGGPSPSVFGGRILPPLPPGVTLDQPGAAPAASAAGGKAPPIGAKYGPPMMPVPTQPMWGSNLASFGREFVLGAVEKAGIDPTSPHTIWKSIAGMPEQAIRAFVPAVTAATSASPMPFLNMMVGAPLRAVGESVEEGAQGIREGDPEKMAHGLGGAFVAGKMIEKPVTEGASAARAGLNAVRTGETATLIGRRMIQTILKPDKAAVIGEADPVGAVANLGKRSRSMRQLQSNIQTAIDEHESMLEQAMDRRREAAGAAGQLGRQGIDVEPILRQRVGSLIEQARRNGQEAMATQLQDYMDSRLNDMRKRLGTTYLQPEDILNEKRFLRDEVSFKAHTVEQQNLNAARLGFYRGLDHALDTLVPDAADINRNYAGLVVADKLLEGRIHSIGNLDFTRHTAFSTLKAHVPDVALKTSIAKFVRGEPAPPSAPPGVYEFHPPSQRSLAPKTIEGTQQEMIPTGGPGMFAAPPTRQSTLTPFDPRTGTFGPETTIRETPPAPYENRLQVRQPQMQFGHHGMEQTPLPPPGQQELPFNQPSPESIERAMFIRQLENQNMLDKAARRTKFPAPGEKVGAPNPPPTQGPSLPPREEGRRLLERFGNFVWVPGEGWVRKYE